MALSDISRDAVFRAVAEFDRLGRDAFIARYGYGASRGYWLEIDGRRYDSKAIVGVAHGFIDGLEVLRPSDFSGGAKTVEVCLRSLGFELVQRDFKQYAWTREEIILALNLYIERGCQANGASPPSPSDEDVRRLSDFLNQLEIHPRAHRAPSFRNPNGVARKLGNLQAAERNIALSQGLTEAEVWPLGNPHTNRLDEAVLDEFWGRWESLREEARRVRALGVESADSDVGSVTRVPVEATRVGSFKSAGTSGGPRTRVESELRDSFAAEMVAAGHEVSARTYRVSGETGVLRCDVFVDSLNLLVEVKASDHRGHLRYAIGQLFDYRLQHSPPQPDLAVLVPYKPRASLLSLLESLGIGCIWRNRAGQFKDTRRGALVP